MSTRSQIGIRNDDLTVTSIYCHFDGYLDGVGMQLLKHYQDENKIKELIKLGDISCLEESLIDTIAYCRDRGEDLHQSKSESVDKYIEAMTKFDSWVDYVYLYIYGEWVHYDNKTETWIELSKEYCLGKEE